MIERFAVCLSIAIWCFLNTWVELAQGEGPYFARFAPLQAVVLPVAASIALITLALFAAWEFWRRHVSSRFGNSKYLALVVLVLCCIPVGIFSLATLRLLPVAATPLVRSRYFWPVALAAGVWPIRYATLHPQAACRFLRSLFLYSWPVLGVVLIQAARATLRYPVQAYADASLAARLPHTQEGTRVVWILFDELSETVAFTRRPGTVSLPHLDRLRAESFSASAAQPTSDATITAVPSLLLGTHVISAVPAGPTTLWLTLSGKQEQVDWKGAPNVFDRARQMGFNTSLVGWFHPYGRLLSHSLTSCYWNAGHLLSGIEEPSAPQSLLQAMKERARMQAVSLPLVGHLPGVDPLEIPRQEKIIRFQSLLQEAQKIAVDPSIGFALIHLPVPHPPGIYSRSQDRFTARDRTGYLDSLALADETLGTLRSALEAAGLWDRTALLVSSDHGWRRHLWRGGQDWLPEEESASVGDTMGVPFLLRLPGQTNGLTYGKPFDTVVTSRVILDVLRGRIRSADDVRAAIESSDAELRR